MDSLGYWLFLLILYMLSIMMKKRQQKAARQQLEQDEDTGWQTPDFVKEIFADIVDSGEDELEESVFEELDEEIEEVIFEDKPEELIPEIPLEDIHLAKSDLPTLGKHAKISTIAHKEIKKVTSHSIFFQKQDDIRMAMIYKEILDKPRSLRRSIR